MEKLFYADETAFPSSKAALEYIFAEYFKIPNPKLARTENGKPYWEDGNSLFFSVTHTKGALFIAFSDKNVGVDAERLNRAIDLPALLKKFPPHERTEIASAEDFLRHWTVKESAIKWLGGTLAHDLKKLSYLKGVLRYSGLEIPLPIFQTTVDGHILSVCSERDFSNAEVIKL